MPVGNAVAVEVPETQFTRVGGDRIAYQVFGAGPPDLLVAASTDAMDLRWDWPPYAHWFGVIASFSRVILFDRRGSAASDPVSQAGASVWEDWADDPRAVLDAVGSRARSHLGRIRLRPDRDSLRCHGTRTDSVVDPAHDHGALCRR